MITDQNELAGKNIFYQRNGELTQAIAVQMKVVLRQGEFADLRLDIYV